MKKTALFLTLLLILFSGCVGSKPQADSTTSTTTPTATTSTTIMPSFGPPVKGDLVSIDYTVTWQGEVFDTSIKVEAETSPHKELIESMHPRGFEPLKFIVDAESADPASRIFSSTVKTMISGDTRSITEPAEIFGWTHKDELVQTQPRSFTLPILETLSSEEFQTLFEKTPKKDMHISWYKHWNSTVTDIEAETISIRHNAINGSTYTGIGGTITIETSTETIKTTFNPELGKTFLTPDNRYLTYTDVGPDSVVADYNHPLAGKTIEIEITLKSITSL